jgi:ferredoxin
MANPKKRVPENTPGDFFVASTCINCDACRQIAPPVFAEAAETSFVKAQPTTSADWRHALQALLACPTGSIGCLADADVKAVMKDFPLLVEEPVFIAATTRRSRMAATATSSGTQQATGSSTRRNLSRRWFGSWRQLAALPTSS